MTAARAKWLGWLVALAVVAALAGVLWYAHAHGWLATAYAWVRHRAANGRTGNGGPAQASMPGMDQQSMSRGQAGMDLDTMSMGTASAPAKVQGHAEVTIPGLIYQRIGVTVGRVERGPLRMSVRTVGIVEPNETKLAHVHLKTEGWVEKLFIAYTGQRVRKGDPLLAIYSPEFLTTQQNYLDALRAERGEHRIGPQSLSALARQRLELWDVPAEEINQLKRTGKPEKYLMLRSPITGTVLSKNVFIGQYVTARSDLYLVADLSTVWVQAKVYEYELPHVELGQPAVVTLADLPGTEFKGKVVFIQPTVEEKTRTVQVRIEIANRYGLGPPASGANLTGLGASGPGTGPLGVAAALTLSTSQGPFKPGMFADVTIQHAMGEGLLVPTSAIIRTGVRDIAYRAESKGRFVPVEVEIDPITFGNRFHILKGLKEGEWVSTSANFLIDSESRLRLSGGAMPPMPGMDMGGMKGMDHSKMKH